MRKIEFKGVVEAPDEDFNGTDVRIAVRDGVTGAGMKVDFVETRVQAYSELHNTRKALNRDVLVVVRVGGADDWAAYIGAVPGRNHDDEEEEVARHGGKLIREEATHYFPQFDPKKYRR